jgi:hypothetical protein
MLLPGSLRQTTIGDVLGTLHRARATGTLEVLEELGRAHRVHMVEGLVASVELDGAAPSLAEVLRRERLVSDDVLRRSLLRALASRRLHGEVLVADSALTPTALDTALRKQILARLARLEHVSDARLRFRVMVSTPRGGLRDRPLTPSEFLAGRRRMRDSRPQARAREYMRTDRAAHAPPHRNEEPTARPPPVRASAPSPRDVLGLAPDADVTAIKRAYRELALRLHPDRHPSATEQERRALAARFAEVTKAYTELRSAADERGR